MQRVKRLSWVPTLALSVLGTFCASHLAHASEEAIQRFHAEIEIKADGSLSVVEHIDILALGREVRRGFIREFPTRYRDRLGNQVVVDFDMLDATRNGQPEPYWTERIRNGVEIFLGDDSFLETQRTHAYTLHYRTSRQLGFFADFDELYWNVTGTGWIFPIDASSATVRLPAPLSADALKLACYTGHQDATGTDCRFEVPEPGVVRFQTTRRLRPNEGLTIAVGFPKGLVAEPSAAARIGFLLRDNGGVMIATIGFLLLLAWYLFQWQRKGRDPSPGVIFPRYQPPQDHSPAGIRYLRRMGWDSRCFSADLVDAGVRGHLTIHRDKPTAEMMMATLPQKQREMLGKSKLVQRMLDLAMKGSKELWRIERNAEGDAARLTEGQRSLVGKLFAGRSQLILRNSDPEVVKAMQGARSEQQKALANQYKPKYFVGNGSVVGWGTLFSIVYLVAAFVAAKAAGNAGIPLIAIILVLSLALHITFAILMKQPTAEGRRLLDEIEGLRMYLGLAEKSDIARLKGPSPAAATGDEPPLDAERYEQLLPYALALDVEDAWTRKFTLAAAAAGVAAAATGAQRWYRGNLAQVSNLGDMSKSLGSALSRQIASSSSPPGSSSGSGGGGRSGGGGGGGGGRGR